MSKLLALPLLLALVGCFSDPDCGEDGIAVTDLPAAVTDAIEAEYPGATLLEAELEEENYEVEIETADGEILEVEVSEDGEILEVEVEVEDDDDDDDDDDEDDDRCEDEEDDDDDDD